MTAGNLTATGDLGHAIRERAAIVVGIAGIAGATALRWVLLHAHVAPGVDGVFFAVALLGTAVAVRSLARTTSVTMSPAASAGWPLPRSIAFGVLGGLVLVAVPFVARLPAAGPLLPASRPDVSLPLWVAVTVLVAVSEEIVFRGALLDALSASGSLAVSVALTSLCFALVHVPFYGWVALPVDICAGVWLAGLRVTAGRVAAPAAAHIVADLVTWWL